MGNDELLRRVLAFAAKQRSTIGRWQAHRLGADDQWLRKQVARGRLLQPHHHGFVVAGTPPCWQQRTSVAALSAGPGSFGSSLTSVGVWLPQTGPPPFIEISVSHERNPMLEGVVVRRRRDMHLAKGRLIDGVPVTGLPRALLDAAEHASHAELLAMIDEARKVRHLSVLSLADVLDAHRRQGRRGQARLRAALIDVVGSTVKDSDLERWVWKDLQGDPETVPIHHHTLVLPNGDPCEMDFAWLPEMVNLKTDGGDHQYRVQRVLADKARDRMLIELGWVVPRLDSASYIKDRAAAIASVRRTVRRRRQKP